MAIKKRSDEELKSAVNKDGFWTPEVKYKVQKWIKIALIVGAIIAVGTIGSNYKEKKEYNEHDMSYQKMYGIKDGVDYNDFIVDTFDYIQTNEGYLYDTDFASTQEEIQQCNKVLSDYQNGLEKLQNVGGWKNDRIFIDEALKYAEKNISFYQKYCNLLEVGDGLSDYEFNRRYDEIEKLDDELHVLFQSFQSAQKTFARKHNYEIKKSDQ